MINIKIDTAHPVFDPFNPLICAIYCSLSSSCMDLQSRINVSLVPSSELLPPVSETILPGNAIPSREITRRDGERRGFPSS